MNYLYLCFICLIIMCLFINAEVKQKYLLAVILKGLASLCFVIFGILSSIQVLDMQFAKMVKIGLLLGMIADVLLNLRFLFKKGKIFFLIGILVFLAGHILYLCALIPSCNNVVLAVVVAVIATAITLFLIFKVIDASIVFKVFGVFYIGTIVFMNVVAIMNLIANPITSNIIYTIGAISFLISDIVLIINTFGKTSKTSLRITNLSLYYIGQLLIALSLQFM